MLLGKFFNKIKNIRRVKFVLDKKKIVVFDGLSVSDLKYVLREYNYFARPMTAPTAARPRWTTGGSGPGQGRRTA